MSTMNNSKLILSAVSNYKPPTNKNENEPKSYLETIKEPIENKIYRYQIINGIPGLSCHVSENFKPVYSCCLGHSNIETLANFKLDTVSRIGSISKIYCMLAIKKLINEGKICLNDKIVDCLPWLEEKVNEIENAGLKTSTFSSEELKALKEITIEDILRHESGIRHYSTDQEFTDKETLLNLKFQDSKSALEFLNLVPEIICKTGNEEDQEEEEQEEKIQKPLDIGKFNAKEFSYSTHAFTYLSAIIEQASEKKYDQYLLENFFKPLKLTTTYPDTNETIIGNRASGYIKSKTGSLSLRNPKEIDQSWKLAGGGLISSALDTVKLGEYLLEELYNKNDEFTIKYPNHKWLIGLDSKNKGHTGGSIGGTCILYINTEKQLVIALLNNLSSSGYGMVKLMAEIDSYF